VKERGDEEREGIAGNGSIESAAQRNAPPLLWSGSFAGAPPRSRATEQEREREGRRKRERGACTREREREGKRENEREGDTEKGEERKVPTDAEGRPTYIRRPIPTGRGGQEDERRAKPSRVGLGQVYPSATHTALLLRVPSRRGEPHEGGGATPS